MLIRTLADASADAQTIEWWQQWWEIISSPAHWLGEFTIETLFAVVGVHTIHKYARVVVHGVVRRARSLFR